jgi:hypothetical protein
MLARRLHPFSPFPQATTNGGSMATKLVVFAVGLVLVLSAYPAPAQEPTVTSDSEVTLVGCVEGEQDYRTRVGLDAAGIGEQDVVLTDTTPTSQAPPDAAWVGHFSLTGSLEPQLLEKVGQRVEIAGVIEDLATEDMPGHMLAPRRLFIKVWQPVGPCTES